MSQLVEPQLPVLREQPLGILVTQRALPTFADTIDGLASGHTSLYQGSRHDQGGTVHARLTVDVDDGSRRQTAGDEPSEAPELVPFWDRPVLDRPVDEHRSRRHGVDRGSRGEAHHHVRTQLERILGLRMRTDEEPLVNLDVVAERRSLPFGRMHRQDHQNVSSSRGGSARGGSSDSSASFRTYRIIR
jgi:hypothetical protein